MYFNKEQHNLYRGRCGRVDFTLVTFVRITIEDFIIFSSVYHFGSNKKPTRSGLPKKNHSYRDFKCTRTDNNIIFYYRSNIFGFKKLFWSRISSRFYASALAGFICAPSSSSSELLQYFYSPLSRSPRLRTISLN